MQVGTRRILTFGFIAAVVTGFVLFAFTGFAKAQVVNALDTEPAKIAGAQDPTLSFCYFAGKAYSEGAELNGAVCVRGGDSTNVFKRGQEQQALRWVRPPEIQSVRPR